MPSQIVERIIFERQKFQIFKLGFDFRNAKQIKNLT
jgi:hypothetical protein